MEEINKNKELDTFAKKYVKEIQTESPSKDFTVSIMNNILAEETKKSEVITTELISKKVWFLLFAAIIGLFFIPFKTSEESFMSFPKVDFSFLDKIQIPTLFESLAVSNTVLYAILFFGLMFFAQVVFLKNHFNKRFE